MTTCCLKCGPKRITCFQVNQSEPIDLHYAVRGVHCVAKDLAKGFAKFL